MQSSQPKEPLIQTEIPPGLWHTIGTDLFYLNGAEYLLVADYYSKYQLVREVLKGKSSSRTIANLTKEIFSEQGIPKIERSDNGPHFEGQAYKEFAKQYRFQHITSSPHYPRSKGFIESQVKTTKKTMKKARATNTDPHMALLCLRATPINSTLPSLADLLFDRPIQDNLPKKMPKDKTTEEVTSRLLQRQATQKYYHNVQKYKTTRTIKTWSKYKHPRPKDANLETRRDKRENSRSTPILHYYETRRRKNQTKSNTNTTTPSRSNGTTISRIR